MIKRSLALGCVVLMAVILCSGCNKPTKNEGDALLQYRSPEKGDVIAVFETSQGTFKALLYRDQAPLAVDNFVQLADSGYYDGCEFHRVIADFVIQTGDPTGTGSGGESASGTPFRNEYSEKLHHFRGALGMANAATDQNKSQFYVVQGATVTKELLDQMAQLGYDQAVIDAYTKNGGTPTLDFRYTVFGQVYEGLDIVETISKVKTKDDRPVKAVTLISVVIETFEAV